VYNGAKITETFYSVTLWRIALMTLGVLGWVIVFGWA